MSARLVLFCICSVLLHLATILLLFNSEKFAADYSQSRPAPAAHANALIVNLLHFEKPLATPILQAPVAPLAFTTPADSPRAEVMPTAVQPPMPPRELEPDSGFAKAGTLTRRPLPVDDVDLDVRAIDEVAITTTIELTVLVDVDGTVAGVSTAVDDPTAKIFAERVAERFLKVRFRPGEIDGKSVRSEWRITVVSEPAPARPRQ